MELVISHLFVVAITQKRHVIQHSSFSNFIWDVFKKLQINLKNNGRLPWSEKAVIFSWNCFTEGISLLALENNPQATSRSKDNIQDSCLLASWMEELCHKHCICVLTFVAETPVTLGCCMQTWLTNKGKFMFYNITAAHLRGGHNQRKCLRYSTIHFHQGSQKKPVIILMPNIFEDLQL